jgi:hypothetical protein
MTRLKVACVSTNTNSFGLRGSIFVSDDGRGYEAAANDLNLKPEGAVTTVPAGVTVENHLTALGYELPRRLDPDPPPGAVREVWGQG